MAEEPIKFTHIGVKEETQRMISILAKVANGSQRMYDLVDVWAKDAWEEAKLAGVVTDAMLNPPAHWVGGSEPKKKRATRAAREVQGA